MEQLHVHDVITGARLFQVHPSSGSWRTRINGHDESSFTFQLRDAENPMPRDLVRDLFRANARMLVLSDGGHVKCATVNLTPVYDRESGTVTVRGRGIRMFAKQRMTFGVANYAQGDLPIVGRSYSGAVRAIVQRMMQWGGIWPLPIDLPADGSGSYSNDVKRWDFYLIDDLLGQVEAEGVEVYFRPYLDAAGSVRFQTRVASQITIGSALHLPVSVEESRVTGLSVTEDGSMQLTGAFAIGEGTEADTVTGLAWAMAGEDSPVRDAALQLKQVADVGALSRAALAELTERRNTIKEWSFKLAMDGLPVDAATPGSLLDLDVRGDEWIPDGIYRQRVLSNGGVFGSFEESPEVQLYVT